MRQIDHQQQALEEWRPGVTTRMRVSAINGASQLCIFEQWCEPGKGAPTHLHAVEEVLSVLVGEAEVWVDTTRCSLSAGQTVIVPAGRKHGFHNTGTGTLHVQAILAAPIFRSIFRRCARDFAALGTGRVGLASLMATAQWAPTVKTAFPCRQGHFTRS